MKPQIKTKIKIATDILLTLALFFCMGYQFWGEALHEWVGAGMYLLFFLHQALNLGWYKTLFKGRYSALRVVQCVLNFLVLASMLALIYSGIVMSRYVFAALPVHAGMALARRLHLLGSYWGFLLMSLHLGMHWNLVLNRVLSKQKDNRALKIACFIAGAAVAVRGVWVLISRNWAETLFLQNEFIFLDYSEPPALFYLDMLCLMGLCVFAAHYGTKLLRAAMHKEGSGR